MVCYALFQGVSGGYVGAGAVGGTAGGADGATFAPDSPYFPFTSPSRRPLPHNAAGECLLVMYLCLQVCTVKVVDQTLEISVCFCKNVKSSAKGDY